MWDKEVLKEEFSSRFGESQIVFVANTGPLNSILPVCIGAVINIRSTGPLYANCLMSFELSSQVFSKPDQRWFDLCIRSDWFFVFLHWRFGGDEDNPRWILLHHKLKSMQHHLKDVKRGNILWRNCSGIPPGTPIYHKRVDQYRSESGCTPVCESPTRVGSPPCLRW